MSFVDKLKGLFAINIDLSGVREIHILSDNSNNSNNEISYKRGRLTINSAKIGAEKLLDFQKSLEESVVIEGNILMEGEAQEILTDFEKVEEEGGSRSLLDFFKGRINSMDFEVLRASFYVKSVYDRGNRVMVARLKEQITSRYGQRGANIVNLCTAGYFSSFVKPLFEEFIKDSKFEPIWLANAFDNIVNNSPIAIFVNHTMTKSGLIKEIKSHMSRNKAYGIHNINIHGIGEENIKNIGEALHEINDEFTQQPDIESHRNYMIVTVYF